MTEEPQGTPLPDNAEILESGVVENGAGRWVALITFRVPGQGGYDRMPSDDMVRSFEREELAQEWLRQKLKGMST